jgi:hypothetical protein
MLAGEANPKGMAAAGDDLFDFLEVYCPNFLPEESGAPSLLIFTTSLM